MNKSSLLLLSSCMFCLPASEPSHDIVAIRMSHDKVGKGGFTKQSMDRLKIEAKHGNPFAMNELGVMALSIREFHEAIAWFILALEIKSEHPTFNSNIAQAYKAIGNNELAKFHYEKAASKGRPRAMNALGSFALEEDKFDEAITWFQKAIDIDNKLDYVTNIAIAYHLKGDIDQAIIKYKDAAFRGDADAMHVLGLIETDRQNYDEAITWLKKAVNKTHNPKYIINLAYAYQITDNTEEAFRHFKLAAEKGEPSAASWLGMHAIDQQNYDQAIRWLNKAVRLDEEQADYFFALGYAYAMKGNETKARRYYKKANALKAD